MRLLLVSVLLLGSCSKIPGTSSNLEAHARDVLSDTLYDADSARFRNIRAVVSAPSKGKEERIICGEVNAKNKMGVYIGFRNFLVSRESRFGVVDPQTAVVGAKTEAEIDEKAYQDGFNAIWPACLVEKGRGGG